MVLVVVVQMLWLNDDSNRGYSTSVLHAMGGAVVLVEM